MKITTLFAIAVTCTLSACATGPRQVDMAEVVSMEGKVGYHDAQRLAQQQSEKIYVQPMNKKEQCKLPSTPDLLARKNFRTYWDGECKNGYAYGLGREIALSDTNHLEEIIVYGGVGDSKMQPMRMIDFVQNISHYGTYSPTSNERTFYIERIENQGANFSIQSSIGAIDQQGNLVRLDSSPLHPAIYTLYQPNTGPAYWMEDYSALPAPSDQGQLAVYAVDPSTEKPIGFRIVRFRNGVVQHQRLAADGSIAELVHLPKAYAERLVSNINEAQAVVQKSKGDIAKAQAMEREYLHMACSAGYSIKGVPAKDMKVARKICTWRDQWKEPYAKAEAKYKHEMLQKQQEVDRVQQQRALVAAQQAQAAALENAAFAASMANLNQTMQQQNYNLLQQINQSNMQMMNQNNQMMNAWTPQPNKTTFCHAMGSQIICR
jgi:hypothetical protein